MNLLEAKAHVGRGWHDLVQMAYDLMPAATQVVQVKEKFGMLRIYVTTSSDEYYEFLRRLEGLSGCICENCGDLGKLRPGGWIKTLCDKCQEKRKEG